MSKKRNRRNRWRRKVVKEAKRLQPHSIIVEARLMGIYVDDLLLGKEREHESLQVWLR